MTETLSGKDIGETLPPQPRVVRLDEKFVLFPQGVGRNQYDEGETEAGDNFSLRISPRRCLPMEVSISYIPPREGVDERSNFAFVVCPQPNALTKLGLITEKKRRITAPFLVFLQSSRFIIEIPSEETTKEATKIILGPVIEPPKDRQIKLHDGQTQDVIDDSTFSFGLGDDYEGTIDDNEVLLIMKNLSRIKGTFTAEESEEV